MDHFYLKDIELQNFRKFDNAVYKLNPHMNVFIGRNASGKTAVLEAVTVILGAYLAAFKEYVPARFVRNISENDVLRKSVQSVKNVAVTPSVKQFPCMVGSHMMCGGEEIHCERILEKEGGKSIPGRTDAYQRCLDERRGCQSAFEYIKLLRGLAAEENNGTPLPAYTVIMDAVKFSLKDELSQVQQVLYSSRYGEIAVKNQDGTIINFSALSDGYRNVIKVVIEIAARMCILNPYLGGDVLRRTSCVCPYPNTVSGNSAPAAFPGTFLLPFPAPHRFLSEPASPSP